ncbi:MAG: PAS domain-containing protein [bacterium]
MEPLYNLLRSNLKSIRTARGLSQEELSLNCHYDRTYIGKIERGSVQPSLEALFRLADRLNVRIADFFARRTDFQQSDPTNYPHFHYETSDDTATEANLNEDSERFSLIFEAAHHPIALLDDNGTVLEVNPSFCELIGRSLSELTGKRLWEGNFWKHDHSEAVRDAVRTAGSGEFVHRELSVQDNDRTETHEFTFSPVREEDGNDYIVVEATTPAIEQPASS